MTFLVCAVALVASILTFFSGFGLGTLLTPVFVLFFPIEQAVAMTAIVHFANSLFKTGLIGRFADRSVLFRFGVPAILFALVGAKVLSWTSHFPSLYSYSLAGRTFEVFPIKLTMGILILFFTLFEMLPSLKSVSFDSKYLHLGGAVSGFFGGLSGHQGALRSAFLTRLNLSKESFIATGTILAIFVDASRLAVYSTETLPENISEHWQLLTWAVLSAVLGALIGNRLLKKITMESVQKFVAVALIALGLAIAVGIV